MNHLGFLILSTLVLTAPWHARAGSGECSDLAQDCARQLEVDALLERASRLVSGTGTVARTLAELRATLKTDFPLPEAPRPTTATELLRDMEATNLVASGEARAASGRIRTELANAGPRQADGRSTSTSSGLQYNRALLTAALLQLDDVAQQTQIIAAVWKRSPDQLASVLGRLATYRFGAANSPEWRRRKGPWSPDAKPPTVRRGPEALRRPSRR